MENLFFGPDFQFEKYLNERLLEVSDEGERKALKEVLYKTLLPFYEHAEERYGELQKRLSQSDAAGERKFELITTISRRDQIDSTDTKMFPMNYEDLNEKLADGEEMLKKVREGKAYPLFRVFLQADYPTLRRIQKEKRRFCGMIYTQDGEYRSEVRLTPDHSYLSQIAELYPLFEKNGIPWKTACIPYLSKFFDVEVLATDCPENQTVTKYKIDFEEYADIIKYDVVPMWNVRVLKEKTGAYPDLAVDRVHYEHVIYRNHFEEGRDYLAAEKDVKLWNVFFQDGDMHIVCDDPNPRTWYFLEFNYQIRQGKWETPYFGNGEEGGRTHRIHTKAEIKRFFEKLSCKNMELTEIEWKESGSVEEMNTYSMDEFLADEIRVGKHREILLLKFRLRGEKDYLTYDVMSYLVSRIQWELPEFLCVGELE